MPNTNIHHHIRLKKHPYRSRWQSWLFHLSPVLVVWTVISPPDFFVLLSLQALALQLVVVWALFIVGWLFWGKAYYLLLHMVGILVVFFYLKPYVQSSPRQTTNVTMPTFKALHLNVHGRSTQHQALTSQLLVQDADLLALIEVNHRWAKALKTALKPHYSYAYIYPVDNLFSGIAIFAKYPLTNVRYVFDDEPPTVVGDVHLPQGKVHFISTHISAPILQGRIPRRYRQMEKIAQEVAQHKTTPILLLGDFNAVPWETLIKDFKQTTQMQDVRTSWLPTFPTWALWTGIPIDYIFYSPKLSCQQLTTFQNTGSDHVGLVGEFSLN